MTEHNSANANNAPPLSGPALVVRGPHDVGLEEREARPPAAREVQVTPLHVGLCGTDLEIIGGAMDPAYVRYPVVLGHEWSGRVAAVGAAVTRVQPGDHVVVEGIIPCGVCDACRRGDTNLCETYDELGFVRDGAAGPGVTVAEHLVHRLAPGVALDAAAMVEPSSVVLRGLSQMALPPGLEVLIVGDGTVGLLAAALIKLWSPARVTLAGQRKAQADLALAMGADHITFDPPQARSFDLTIEAAGSLAAVDIALSGARRGGQVLLLGIAGHGQKLPIETDDLVNNDLRVRGSFGYTASAWAQVTRLLNAGRFDPGPLITHRFALAHYAQALAVLADPGDEPRGKVLLHTDAATGPAA